MSTSRCKQNDSGRDLTALLKFGGVTPGSPMTGTVAVILKRQDFPAPAIKRTAVIVDANTWSVKYSLLATDTVMPGTYAIEWENTQGGGTVLTYPDTGYDTLIIDPDLG